MIHIYSKPLVTLFLLLLVTTVFSQNFELGKVTLKELQEKVHPIDSSASAAILFKLGNTDFDINFDGYWNVVHETLCKIKIYKKEGYKYANFEESYYSAPGGEKLYFSDVCTYNLVNGKIEKTKIKSNGEFEEKINKDYSVKKITLPNVKEGSIIEFKVTKITFNKTNLSNFYLQYEIPANIIEYRVANPEYFGYNKSLYGYLQPKQRDDKIEVRNADYFKYRTIYQLINVPAMKEESYVNNINNYRSRIRYELSVFKDRVGTPTNYAVDWESVAKKIYEEESFGNELKKKNYFEDDITSLLKGITTNEEKIEKIFDFVKQKMNWDESYGILCDKGVKEAYKTRSGNVAEINLMLTAMLRFAGIDANPVLVSTKSNGISIFPSRTGFNYVISAIDSEKGVVFLDATNKKTTVNILPTRALNWNGRIIRKDETTTEVDLMPNTNSKDNVTILATIDQEGTVKGQVRRLLTDYNAFIYRDKYAAITNEIHVEKIQNTKGGIDIDDLIIENAADLNKPVIENYTFTDNKHSEVINDKIYFSPLLFDVLTENPFKQEKREYPIDFSFPFTDKYMINYQIPTGYEVESMPLPVNMQFGDNIGTFKFNINKTDDKIQVVVQFGINTSIVSSEYYEDIKLFYQKMIEKQNEKIVLKRI